LIETHLRKAAMVRFKDHVKLDRARTRGGATKSATARQTVREASGGSRRMQSLDAASLSLPADMDAGTRASLFREFWDALAAFRHRDILVVAMCADHDE
jgi:hypothetical protein